MELPEPQDVFNEAKHGFDDRFSLAVECFARFRGQTMGNGFNRRQGGLVYLRLMLKSSVKGLIMTLPLLDNVRFDLGATTSLEVATLNRTVLGRFNVLNSCLLELSVIK